MDAIQFIKERDRMCKACGSCILCQAYMGNECAVGLPSVVDPEQQINIVKEGADKHPCKTRQSVFLEQYPEAEIDANGVVKFCPMPISAAHRGSNGRCRNPEKLCRDCRREFWMQEVE